MQDRPEEEMEEDINEMVIKEGSEFVGVCKVRVIRVVFIEDNKYALCYPSFGSRLVNYAMVFALADNNTLIMGSLKVDSDIKKKSLPIFKQFKEQNKNNFL